MANTSATGGYLPPGVIQPLDDEAFLDFLQLIVAGVTGLAGQMVRPAYQPNPPKRPGINQNWCAFWTSNNQTEKGYAYTVNDEDGLGSTVVRHETFDLRCSFYGPNAGHYAGIWRDGLEVGQNREVMFLANIGYVGPGPMTALGELVDQQWFNRVDVTVTLRRELTRRYEVLSFLQALGQIVTETMVINWAVGPEV